MLPKHALRTELFTIVLIGSAFGLTGVQNARAQNLEVQSAGAQNPPAHGDTVPIYDVTVVGRTVDAVNYQYKNGPTQVDFRGTVLLPQAKGDATIESKAGRTEVDAHFEHLASSQQFGAEYLTYVLWAITPEGHAKNLGEVLANGSDKAHTHVTTDLQTFGLIVTAEPYSAVRLPGDVVVLENRVRPDTSGSIVPVQARFELMPRGAYTYKLPDNPPVAGPSVSMSEYEELLELYQAENAVQIAEAQGADRYASDVFDKARTEYENARQMQSRHANKNAVITASRDAAQTAEDARALTVTRKHDAELAEARGATEHEQQLRREAEVRAQSAQTEAAAAQAQTAASDNALELERKARREADERAASLSAAAPTVADRAPSVAMAGKAAPAVNESDTAAMALRLRLFSQLKGSFNVLDTGRGLVITLPDQDFRGTALLPSFAAGFGALVNIAVSHPGLTIEIDGNSDTEGSSGESFSLDRATQVENALIRAGLPASLVTARGLGNSRLFGPNTNAQGRADNRRVEIIIRGAPIGNMASWDRPYSLNLSR